MHEPDIRKPLISLVMIVKNEAKSIQQTIASVKDQIDSYVIVDTGSTDNTVSLTMDALAGVDGQIVHLPFVDYATTRNASLEIAEKSGAVFGLMMSGDETLNDPGRLIRRFCIDTRNGNDGAYRVPIRVNREEFDSHRVVRLSEGWRYVGIGTPGEGVIHEVLMKEGIRALTPRISGCFIRHAETDTARKRSRLYRDLEILREAIRKSPNDARAWYYAARTLEQLGMQAQAHDYYKHRVQMGGSIEEQYNAAFRMASTAILMQMMWSDIQLLFLEAYAINPRRAEPLHAIAYHWYQTGNHALAWMFASIGAAMKYPEEAYLNISRDVYDWQLADIAARSGFYMGQYEMGERYARQAAAGCPGDAGVAGTVKLYEQRRMAMVAAETKVEAMKIESEKMEAAK